MVILHAKSLMAGLLGAQAVHKLLYRVGAAIWREASPAVLERLAAAAPSASTVPKPPAAPFPLPP